MKTTSFDYEYNSAGYRVGIVSWFWRLGVSRRRSCCILFPAIMLLVSFFTIKQGSWTIQSGGNHVLTYREQFYKKEMELGGSLGELPVIYVITPTFSRVEQKADLTRLAQTFLHLSNFHWILVEDSDVKTPLTTSLLNSSGLSFTHLNIKSPKPEEIPVTPPRKGVLQRNLGLSWLRKNLNSSKQDGVVYFADDDNTYDLKLFAEMRWTKRISVWPVGIVGGLRYESPIVKNGKPTRRFATDMAGFAVNLRLLLDKPGASFSEKAFTGYQESDFISTLNITLDDLEPKADNCSKILVWHTKTQTAYLGNEEEMKKKYDQSPVPDMEV